MKKLLALALAAMLALTAVSALAELKVGTYDPASAGNVELSFGWWATRCAMPPPWTPWPCSPKTIPT